MKPIILDQKTQKALLKKFEMEFLAKINSFTFNGSDIDFKAKIGEKAKEKIQLCYTPTAYLRMSKLVSAFDSEVSWFGLVKQLSVKKYLIYDVLVCKQQVNGSKVDTTDEDMLEFMSELTDEQSENMHFQAHSHVNFSTEASGTDLQNQEDILNNMPGREGFYIFQIWNKKGDINTYLYDLDNNLFYDKNDVELAIADDEYGTLNEFIGETRKLVSKIPFQPAQYWPEGSPYNYGNYPNEGYYGGHYGGYYGNERPKTTYGQAQKPFTYGWDGMYDDEFFDDEEEGAVI